MDIGVIDFDLDVGMMHTIDIKLIEQGYNIYDYTAMQSKPTFVVEIWSGMLLVTTLLLQILPYM